MFIPSYMIISFLGALLLVIITVAYLYYLYTKEREFDLKEETADKNEAKIIQGANKKANEIIEEAADKAKKTLSETDYVRQDIVKNLESNLSHVASQALQLFQKNSQNVDVEYKDLFDQAKKEYVAKIDTTLKSLEQIASSELDEFAKNLKREALNSEVFITARINEEFEKKQKEIEEYRQTRLKAVDKNINKIIARVAEQILGKSIPIEEHEQLVLNALESAKKEEVFI